VAVKLHYARALRQREGAIREFHLERECLRRLATLQRIRQEQKLRLMELLCSFEKEDGNQTTFGLVFPFAEGGTLHNYLRLPTRPLGGQPSSLGPNIQNATWRHSIRLEINGLAEALAFLHDEGNGSFAIHGDIKPSNILIHENKLKFSDFGSTRVKVGEESSKTEWLSGTRVYEPPEKELMDKFGRARDVWAFGCVLLELLVLVAYGHSRNPWVDRFEQERVQSTPRRTKAYCDTSECTNTWRTRLSLSLTHPLWMSGLTACEEAMTMDYNTRINAAKLFGNLKSAVSMDADEKSIKEAEVAILSRRKKKSTGESTYETDRSGGALPSS
jgi:serine/threonine protein kinase